MKSKLVLLTLLSTSLLLASCGGEATTSKEGTTSIDAPTSIVEPSSEEVTSVEATSVEPTSEEATSEEITSLEATSVEPTSEEVTSEEVTSEEATSVEQKSLNEVIGKTYVGEDVKQKDFVFYNALLEVAQAMSLSFYDDNTYYFYCGKSHSGYGVREMETIFFGTYSIGEEYIEMIPTKMIARGRESEIPEESRDMYKNLGYFDESGNFVLQMAGEVDQDLNPVTVDLICKEGDPIKEWEKEDSSILSLAFQNAFAEPISGELPAKATQLVANAEIAYGASVILLDSNQGTSQLDSSYMGSTIRYTGTCELGDNAGEYVVQWKKYYVNGEFLLDLTGEAFDIVPMDDGYKVPISKDSDEGVDFMVYGYYTIVNE